MNWGIEQASGEWVLQLDVDERIPVELAEELQQFARMPASHGEALRIQDNSLAYLEVVEALYEDLLGMKRVRV